VGRYDSGALQPWLGQSQNPAAPEGLQQAATAGGGVAAGIPRYDSSKLGQWVTDPEIGYTGAAQSWYTGANFDGTNNGYDNQFVNDYMTRWNTALENGTANTYFESPDATGIVTWDHTGTDGKQYRYGDVYQDGKKVANLYDQKDGGFDKNTANLAMSTWTLSADQKAQAFSASDPLQHLNREITRQRDKDNVDIPQQLKAMEFNADVKDTADRFEQGNTDEAIILGGAAGGAGVGAGAGAAAGSFFFGVGAAPGALVGGAIGGLVGGIGAALNKDSLTEQAARAYEITALSTDQYGGWAGAATGVQQWGGFAGKLISPLQNVDQGLVDVAYGKVGDGTSEFYRTDKAGDSTVPSWVKLADIGAAIGDGALQFASPVGAGLYTAQMGSTIGGETAELALTGGAQFDYNRGGFDNVFTDEKGNFSPTQAAAGIGKIGIDVAQLGLARGLLSKAQVGRAAADIPEVGAAAPGILGDVGKVAYGKPVLRDVLPTWAGGRTAEQAAAIRAGGREEIEAGHRYYTDELGNVVGQRYRTIGLLAPSEAISSLSTRVIALRAKEVGQGALKADDFYRAAQSMAQGERRFTTALVNGFGEGTEEIIQSALENYSHGHGVGTMQEMVNSGIYGAAGGVGMGLGINSRGPTAEDKLDGQVRIAHYFQTGGEVLSDEALKAMTPTEKRAKAQMGKLERETAKAAFTKYADDRAADFTAGIAGVNKVVDAISTSRADALKKAAPHTDQPFVITQIQDAGQVDANGELLPGSMPSDAVVSSGAQLMRNFGNRMRGVGEQLALLERNETDAQAALDAAPADEGLQADLAKIQAHITQVNEMIRLGQALGREIDDRVTRMYDPAATPAMVLAETEGLNQFLRDAFNRRADNVAGTPVVTDEERMALARTVSQVVTRDPQDQSGSYQVLVPQASPKLTVSRSDNVLEVSHAILPAIRGDYDGDKVRTQNQLLLDEDKFVAARAGMHFLGAGVSVNVKAPKYEKWVVQYLSEAYDSTEPALVNAAAGATTSITEAIRRRYEDIIPGETLDEVFDKFFAAVRDGNEDSRSVLLDGLLEVADGPINAFARGNLSNEWLWMDQLVRATFQAFQEDYASYRPLLGPTPGSRRGRPVKRVSEARERRAQRSATTGQTIGNWLAGDAMFRKFQKLHYTSLTASVLSSATPTQRAELYALAESYEMLSAGSTLSELDRVHGLDEITSRVIAQLRTLANNATDFDPSLTSTQAMAVMANTAVLDFDYDSDGNVTTTGREITLAQMLLKQELRRDRVKKDAIFEISPELQAKHARLGQMTKPDGQGTKGSGVNAQRAFVEVFGAFQLFTLVGDAAGLMGPHISVEQYVRFYTAKDEKERKSEDYKLRNEAAYLGRESSANMPYSVAEVAAGDVSPYRSVVDALLSVGHHRITVDTKVATSDDFSTEHLNGEFADAHYRTSKAFKKAHADIREALFKFSELSGRRADELTLDMVQRMLDQNPTFAEKVMALIPDAAANAVFERRDDDLYIANWVYKMFTIRDANKAEMHYWRNVLLAQWEALGLNARTEKDADGHQGRRYSKLDRRMFRILYDLSPNMQADGGLLMTKFMQTLQNAENLEQFLRWVNTTPGIRGNQAPIVGWYDDTAAFDADKANGGWSTGMEGSTQREAIASLQVGAQYLVKDLVEEQNIQRSDNQVYSAIERVLKADAGAPNVTATSEDRRYYDAFVKSISNAREMNVGLGPQALMYQVVGAVRGFYPKAHNKGENPDNVDPAGAFDAMRDAYDYTTNYERFKASMTAVNLDALGGNLSQLAKDGVVSMDDEGRQVEWEMPVDSEGNPTPESVARALALLSNPDTRPLARGVLFPQVMERGPEGRLTTQMLVGKDLKSLLEGDHYKSMFARDGSIDNDSAMRYCAMLEATARNHDGHFSVQRIVNDIVIAETSGANHVLSVTEIERAAQRAFRTVAKIVQDAASVASVPDLSGPATLKKVMREVHDARRIQRTAGLMGFGARPGEDIKEAAERFAYTDVALDQLVMQRRMEMLDEISLIEAKIVPGLDIHEVERIEREVLGARADLDAFIARVELLRADDPAGQAVDMFSFHTDPLTETDRQREIIGYIMTRPDTFRRKSQSSIQIMMKLTGQLEDPSRAGQVDLTKAEWEHLSRATVTVFLDDLVSTGSGGISVSPYPDESRADNRRYYDTSYAYLADTLLNPDGPILKAGVDIHRWAGLQGDLAPSPTELKRTVELNLYPDFRYGPWTGDIPRASIEANQRLDSAASKPVIAMVGNSPKRQAAKSAATRRTFRVPGEELLSRVSLQPIDLVRSLFDEVKVTHPGDVEVSRPLAQLNNRFARRVMLRFRDPANPIDEAPPIDLLISDTNLGHVFHTDDVASGSGYKEIHLDRLRTAIEASGVDPANIISVDVDFFHPDSQPVDSDEDKRTGRTWYNNLFFEGTSFKRDADRAQSLNETLWFTEGGINPVMQAWGLDASKLGRSAIEVIKTKTHAERKLLETDWATDFAGMLRLKTKEMLSVGLGLGDPDKGSKGMLEPEYYNAVYKDMKLQHFVVGNAPGTNDKLIWTAEQVLAHQHANPGDALPIDNAKLWMPSDSVLNTMLGEQGTQGVTRVVDDLLTADLSQVPAYRGVSERMLDIFSNGMSTETVALPQTRIANRSRQQTLQTRAYLDEKTRNAYEAKIRYLAEKREEIWDDRANYTGQTGEGGWNPRTNLANALAVADLMLRAENISMDWTAGGLPFFGARKQHDMELSKMLLHELEAALEVKGSRSGWVFREDQAGDANAGLISGVTLSTSSGAKRIAPGDLVVVELDSFRGNTKKMRERLDWIADQGATIVLGATDGDADSRVAAQQFLEAIDYERLAGSVHVYQPAITTPRYQNQRALVSSLTATRGVSPRSHLAILNVQGLSIHESSMWVDFKNPRLHSIAESLNLVPTNYLAGFNVPVDEMVDDRVSRAQVARVRNQVLGFKDDAEGRQMLRDLSHGPDSPGGKKLTPKQRADLDIEFDFYFDRMVDRLEQNPGSVLPKAGDEFGTGDMIPLVGPGDTVLLYRHGHEAPDRNAVMTQKLVRRPSKLEPANMAVFSATRNPNATSHVGRVVEFNPRSNYGLSVRLEIDLQTLGDKKVLEWNGMKYELTARSDAIRFPTYQGAEHGFFRNWMIDGVASLDDAMSKESTEGMIVDHRSAFTYLGIDFTDDVATFLGVDATTAIDFLKLVAAQAPRIKVEAADEILNSERITAALREQLSTFASSHSDAVDPAWVDNMADPQSVEAKIATSMIVYLMTPGAKVSDVLKSGGFNDVSSSVDSQSVEMPSLFTQVFDNSGLDSELRNEINERLNAQLYNPNGDGTGYSLSKSWIFESRHADPKKRLRGILQFAEAHSAGDNPVINGLSFDEAAKQTVSQHSAAIAYQATGAQTAHTYDVAKAQLFASTTIEPHARDAEDGGLWRMLTGIPAEDRIAGSFWKAVSPAESERRDLAGDAVLMDRVEIKQLDENGWTKSQRTAYTAATVSVVQTLGLDPTQTKLVDFWVRQTLGMPHGLDADGNDLGKISGDAAIEAVKDIAWNVNHGYLPVVGAEVPLLHVHDLQAIFRANQNRSPKWAPRSSLEDNGVKAGTWDEWVKVSLGGAFTSDHLFDPLYLLSLDGYMHTYQSATRDLLDLPVSMDVLLSQQLMDENTNRLFVSVSDEQQLIATDPVTLDLQRASLDQLIGGNRVAGKLVGKAAPASEIAKRREARRKWRKENGIPLPVDVSMKDFLKNGGTFVDRGTTVNGLYRGLINLRVGTALLNPQLYISMGPEQFVRGVLDRTANLLTMQSTAVGVSRKGRVKGLAGRQARLTERLADTTLGAGLARLGLETAYTPDQLVKLNKLYTVMGQRNDFKSMVYKELFFLRPHEPGVGRAERWLENYAKLGTKMQDPTWGTRANTLSRRYMEAALSHIMSTPTLNQLSVDRLIAEMATNPQFLKGHFPQAHEAGMNSIAQLRSLKPTPISLALRGIYEPMSESPNMAYAFLGNVVLKMPMLFSGYAVNVATTILGLQGLSDMAAMFLEGRKKGPDSLFGRVSAKIRGVEFDPEQDATFDMSSVLEGVDLSRSFIRGSLTHTGLFAFGMMAGGLGLSGEDDETKKRRKLAALQGAPVIYDPRRIENDFRNADAMFVDWLPAGLASMFRVTTDAAPGGARSMVQLNWVLKQFISPIMGMEKFYETGDFRNVTWGFEDALGSFPLLNSYMWDDAVQTAAEFAKMADDQAKLGGDHNMPIAASFLTNAVGIYEKMLFENAFVNQIYIARDRYDRDPYSLPLRNSSGALQRDIEGNPRPQNLSMESYIDPETGNVLQGYQSRDEDSATLHALTENRFSLAVMSSLFSKVTGGTPDYFRQQMPEKLRTIQKEPMTKDKAEAIVRSLSQAAGGQEALSLDELVYKIKGDAMASKNWNVYNNADAIARANYHPEMLDPLSVMDAHGREVLTKAGARGVYQGLAKGTVRIGDDSLQGIFIPFEMRNQIQTEWTKELIQEGVDMGLDQTRATARMKRLWYGPLSNPDAKGLGDILWDKNISYDDSIVFKQLNTTYVMGPDARPWATGFKRGGVLGALGLKPIQQAYVSEQSATGNDFLLNTTDLVNGINTGLRALELVDKSSYVPTDVEIGKSIEKAIADAAKQTYTPQQAYANKGSSYSRFPYHRYSGYGHRSYGGGGYSGTSYSQYNKMYALPGARAPFGDDIPFINTTSPFIRREDIHRERVWSERGRLKQWQ